MMHKYCNTCERERPHTYRGVQILPRGNVETYTCDKCGDMSSLPQSAYTVLTNDQDDGQPAFSTGQPLTRSQEREVLHQPGKWDGGSYVVKIPKRGLFG